LMNIGLVEPNTSSPAQTRSVGAEPFDDAGNLGAERQWWRDR